MAWQDTEVVRARLEAWTREVGLDVSDEGWVRLQTLVELWQRYGRAMNLVGATDVDTLADHVQEALQCIVCAQSEAAVDETCRWVDVGSGGGLPGLVIAAVRPCRMILIEPRERRAAFLDLGLAAVGMGAGAVIRARWSVSTWDQEVAESSETRNSTTFTVLSSRAVFAPDRWLREAREVPVPRGIILCHVESSARHVGGEKPRAIAIGRKWSVMGFPTAGG